MPATVSPDLIETSQRLKHRPLQWITAEIKQLRAWTFALDDLARAQAFELAILEQVLAGLRNDVPRYFSLEADVLLPALRLAAHRQDEMETAAGILLENQRQLSSQIRRTVPRLEALRLSETAACSDPWISGLLQDLASRMRGHLTVTTAVVLPIARLRFKPQLAIADARQIEQIVDESRFQPHVAADGVDALAHRGWILIFLQQS